MRLLALLVAALAVGAVVLLAPSVAKASEPEKKNGRRRQEDGAEGVNEGAEEFGPLQTKSEEDLGSGSSLRA